MFHVLEKLSEYEIKDMFKVINKYIDDNKIMIGITKVIFKTFKVIPKIIFSGGRVFKIISYHIDYIINGLIFNTEDNMVQSIEIINGRHPNKDPLTNIFCLDKWMIDQPLNLEYLIIVNDILGNWYIDNCYEEPQSESFTKEEIPIIGHFSINNLM